MAFEKYNFIDEKIKEALTAHRKEIFPHHDEYKILLAEGIRLLEDKLMSETLESQEILELQEELGNLRKGEISEALTATLKAKREREGRYEITGNRPRNHRQPAGGGFRRLARKINSINEITPKPAESKKTEEVFTFDDLRLKAEDKLQLEPPSYLTQERFIVKVIGYLKGSSILVTAPIGTNGFRLPLQEREKVVMRSFSGEDAFAFVSTIIGINNHSFEYIHLSIPEIIHGVKVRKATRIRTNIIATALNSKYDSEEQISAIISDICTEGASLMSKLLLGVKGDVLQLSFRFHLHNIDAILTVKGVIRAMIRGEDSNESIKSDFINHGIEFIDLQPSDHVALQSMIYQQMIENPRSIM